VNCKSRGKCRGYICKVYVVNGCYAVARGMECDAEK
jgi:hypothetical protein